MARQRRAYKGPERLRLYCKQHDQQHWFWYAAGYFHGEPKDCATSIHMATVLVQYATDASDMALDLPDHVLREPPVVPAETEEIVSG